jgi:hypothetical protein
MQLDYCLAHIVYCVVSICVVSIAILPSATPSRLHELSRAGRAGVGVCK